MENAIKRRYLISSKAIFFTLRTGSKPLSIKNQLKYQG